MILDIRLDVRLGIHLKGHQKLTWLFGSEDLCSSILDPWHFIKVSKKESSGSCSPQLLFDAAADSCCNTSDCLAPISPGKKGTLTLGFCCCCCWLCCCCCWLWWPWLALIMSITPMGLDLGLEWFWKIENDWIFKKVIDVKVAKYNCFPRMSLVFWYTNGLHLC